MAAPEVKKLAEEMAGRALVLKVDTEKESQLASRYNIRAIPNFIVLRGGRVVSQQAGLADHQRMRSWLEQAAKAA
jgi:thioredoxin 2